MIMFIVISIIMYIVAFMGIYKSLYAYEKNIRVAFTIVCSICIYFITYIIVMDCSSSIEIVTNIVNVKIVEKAARLIFSPINTFIGGEIISIILNKYKEEKISIRQVLIRLFIFFLIGIGFVILEKGYIIDFIGNLLKNVV